MPSISFFLLSPLSRLPIFYSFVVADIALGYSSSSCRLLHSAKNYDYTQISLCAYLVAAYIPIAKARGITPLFDKLLIRQKDNTNIGPVKMPTLIFHRSSIYFLASLFNSLQRLKYVASDIPIFLMIKPVSL